MPARTAPVLTYVGVPGPSLAMPVRIRPARSRSCRAFAGFRSLDWVTDGRNAVAVAEQTCACGVIKSADCVRCNKPACATHYFTAVWCDDRARWIAQAPLRNYELSIKSKGDTYAEAYASGGPGCTTCRVEAGEQAVRAVVECVARLGRGGEADDLEHIAAHWDALDGDQRRRFGQAVYELFPKRMERVKVTARPSPPVKQRFKKYPVSTGTIVDEIDRVPAVWLSSSQIAITADGAIMHCAKYAYTSSDTYIIVVPGIEVSAYFKAPPYDGSWGQPDRTGHYVFSGTRVHAPPDSDSRASWPDMIRSIRKELLRHLS